jgi:2'-5' RNA ligase
MVRAFLAIPLPPPVIEQLLHWCRQLRGCFPEVRWVRPENLHLTLRFFGDVPEESLEKIGQIMLSIGRLHAPFSVQLNGLGAFPAPHRARVFWLGIRDGGELAALYQAIEQRLPDLGIPRETRPFTPHLTLGRHRGRGLLAGSVLERYCDQACGLLPVTRMALFESRLQPSGAVHLLRRSVTLGTSDEAADSPQTRHLTGC